MIQLFRDEFTFRRWGANPFQMYMVTMLLIFSVLQLIFPENAGIFSPDTATGGTFNNSFTTYTIAGTNTWGAWIAVYGLHTRDFDRSIKVEAWGYLSMITVMLLYVGILIFDRPFPNTSLALGLSEAFVLASIHRTIQILWYFRAKKNGDSLAIWSMLGKLEPDGTMP